VVVDQVVEGAFEGDPERVAHAELPVVSHPGASRGRSSQRFPLGAN
jgi:hypothetical protein